MKIQDNMALSSFTSLQTGGPAERLVLCETVGEIIEAIKQNQSGKLWKLGYGTNVVISDDGLPGLTIMTRGGDFEINDDLIIAEASAWWDDMVESAIEAGLWGLEMTSGIPSSVGGAVVGNIAAYGQQISERLEWIEVVDIETKQISQLETDQIKFSYRASSLQTQPNIMVLRAAFRLSHEPTSELEYDSALKVADELQMNPKDLQARRDIILETRARAGSLYNPIDPNRQHTAGSFFKNPTVSLELAKEIASFDESGKTFDLIAHQNKVHGGDNRRISAALVLLAAGFKRGQTWGQVRLHPQHVLKLENLGGATSTDIKAVSDEIIDTVKQKLSIELEPEVKFIGKFL